MLWENYCKIASLQHRYHGPAKFYDRSGGTNEPDSAMAYDSLRRSADRAVVGVFFRRGQADLYTLRQVFSVRISSTHHLDITICLAITLGLSTPKARCMLIDD